MRMFKFNWLAAALFCLCRAINNDIYDWFYLPFGSSSSRVVELSVDTWKTVEIHFPTDQNTWNVCSFGILFWFSITMDKRCKTSNTFGTHPIKILTLNTRPESRIPLLLPLLGRVICNGNAVQHSHTSQSLLGLLTLTRHNCLPLGHLRNLPWIPSPWIWLKIKQSWGFSE